MQRYLRYRSRDCCLRVAESVTSALTAARVTRWSRISESRNFRGGWIPFAERIGERYDAREMQGRWGRWRAAWRERGTEVNTRECIVCGERTGSVAILRIAPRRFCFRFRCPRSFSAPALTPVHPPPLCPFVSSGSLSLVLLSSGAHSYVKFGTARQRGVFYFSFFLSLSNIFFIFLYLYMYILFCIFIFIFPFTF